MFCDIDLLGDQVGPRALTEAQCVVLCTTLTDGYVMGNSTPCYGLSKMYLPKTLVQDKQEVGYQ